MGKTAEADNPEGRCTVAGTIALLGFTARWQQRVRSAGDCIGHLVRQQAILDASVAIALPQLGISWTMTTKANIIARTRRTLQM